MDSTTILIATVTFVSWGIGSFIAKIAADRLGSKSVFWDLLGYFPAILIYSLVVFKIKDLVSSDRLGMGLGILAGAIGSFGVVGLYILLSRTEASRVVPLTALYPALTAILAFIFLRESIDTPKLIGILLSIVAIYLLSK